MTHSDIKTIAFWCGQPNVDVIAGWEKGLGPRQRIGRKLFDYSPPAHLTGQRFVDWSQGYQAAQRYRKAYLVKAVHFVGEDASGARTVLRFKGWSAKRGTIVSRLEKLGCRGDVMVYYFEGSELKRTVQCGI